MPGIIVFRRRWSVGSDDLIVPAVFLVILHVVWLIVLGVTSSIIPELDTSDLCQSEYSFQIISYILLWSLALIVEVLIVVISLRGTILEDEQRWSAEYLLYVKLVLWLIEIGLTVASMTWVKDYYIVCSIPNGYRSVMLGLVIFNSIIFLTAIMTIWCVFDVAGRSWVKLKNYQKSLRDQGTKSKFQYKRSGGNSARSWRHRKVRRAYQNSWDNRCQILFCCVKTQNRKSRSSFADIARVLSEFFRDLDVVPSDVVVGLVLLRQRQQLLRFRVIHQPTNSVYQFLSGVRVTPETPFLDLAGRDIPIILEIHHYMHFAVGMYGWPMYLRKNTGIATLRLCSSLRCGQCLPCCHPKPLESIVVDDNCCGCNFAAYKKMCHLQDCYVIYITYHVDVGETPFLIAIDYSKKAIVLSIRGTLSLQDVITDLNAEGEPLPIRPVNEEWIGHKGMVNAAAYIYKKVKEEHLLTKAFNWDKERGTQNFQLVCVGHSLGGGTAAILAIMLKQEYPETRCFSFSPPGGLLSQQAVEYSRPFVTSVVLGKDVVPRIGLHQLEALRHNLIYAIHKSKDPKWKTLTSGLTGFVGRRREWTAAEVEAELSTPPPKKKPDGSGGGSEDLNIHPWDSTVNLSVHQPLYPPGRVIHIVRQYPRVAETGEKKTNLTDSGNKRPTFKRDVEPTFRAVWADNQTFDEVLISKRMVQDHMPDNVLDALDKILLQNNLKPDCVDLDVYQKNENADEDQNSTANHHQEQNIEIAIKDNDTNIDQEIKSSNFEKSVLGEESNPLLNIPIIDQSQDNSETEMSPTSDVIGEIRVAKIAAPIASPDVADIPINQQSNVVTTTVVAEIVANPQRDSPGTSSPTRQLQHHHHYHRHHHHHQQQQHQQQLDDESTTLSNGGDQMSQNVIKMPNTEKTGDVVTCEENSKLQQVITDVTSQSHVAKSSFHEAEKHTVAKSFQEVDVSTNCPSVPALTYETTYPVFTGQTEYGQEGMHVEPFYRYRVYSESKV